jgi:hypothetical protein
MAKVSIMRIVFADSLTLIRKNCPLAGLVNAAGGTPFEGQVPPVQAEAAQMFIAYERTATTWA